jgi:PIN domain nuclease of toxin-antitoxin system
VLLDTHAFVWFVGDSQRLRPETRRFLADMDCELFLSAASVWEIATKVRIGRFPEAVDLLSDFVGILDRFMITPMAVTILHAMEAGMLPGPHRDPFDRMLIAQSILEELPIVTRDPAFANYDGKVIW